MSDPRQPPESDKKKRFASTPGSGITADSASSILIILMGSLGDVARGLCLVSGIKAGLPFSRVTWLVEPKCRDLVEIHPGIDRVIVFDRPRGISALPGLYKHLARERFDIVLDLQRHFKSGLFSLFSGAGRRIGFHPRDSKECNRIFNNEYIPYYGEELPKWQHYLTFLNQLGIAVPDVPDFGLSEIDLTPDLPAAVARLTGPFVVVVMGSAWKSKDWVHEGYLGLIRQILASGKMQAVMVGESSQTTTSKRLCEQCTGSLPVNLVGKTSIRELLAVIQAAAAAVGPDSGPGHLAAAVGTPYVALFGPTSARRTAPCGNEHLVVDAGLGCSPCYKRICPGFGTECMRAIQVETVKENLSEAILGDGKRGFFD